MSESPKFSTGGADRRVRQSSILCDATTGLTAYQRHRADGAPWQSDNERTGPADRRVAALAQLRVAIDDGVIDDPYAAVLALRQQTRSDVTEFVEAADGMRGEMTCDSHPLDSERIDVPNCDCCDPCNAARAYDLASAKLRDTPTAGSPAKQEE